MLWVRRRHWKGRSKGKLPHQQRYTYARAPREVTKGALLSYSGELSFVRLAKIFVQASWATITRGLRRPQHASSPPTSLHLHIIFYCGLRVFICWYKGRQEEGTLGKLCPFWSRQVFSFSFTSKRFRPSNIIWSLEFLVKHSDSRMKLWSLLKFVKHVWVCRLMMPNYEWETVTFISKRLSPCLTQSLSQ